MLLFQGTHLRKSLEYIYVDSRSRSHPEPHTTLTLLFSQIGSKPFLPKPIATMALTHRFIVMCKQLAAGYWEHWMSYSQDRS